MASLSPIHWLIVVVIVLLIGGPRGGPPWSQGMLALRKRWGRWREP